jgi:hypothetical protein
MFAIYLTDCFLQNSCIAEMPADGDCFFHAVAHQIRRCQAVSKITIGAFIGFLVHFKETNAVHTLVHQDAHDPKFLRKIAANYIRENPAKFQDFVDDTTSLEVISYDLIFLCGILNLDL